MLLTNDLFGQPITEAKPVHHHGHPTRPGTGPKGETCGTCEHRVHVKSGRHTYQKCRLIRANWSHGPGTDIKKKDAACALWAQKQP